MELKKILKPLFLKNTILLAVFDVLWSPLTLLSAIWLKFIRLCIRVLPVSDAILMKIGVLPVVDHFYQPLINPKKYLKDSLKTRRNLPGVKYNNDAEQFELLSAFHYNDELLSFPREKTKNLEYYYNNSPFGPGDAEYLYNIVRHFKPARIIEIGCGNSTLMIRNAIKNNVKDDAGYTCNHMCIEPYQKGWFEQTGVSVMRKRIEEVDPALFTTLQRNDILFVDTSHMIRPQGDVLFEFLQIFPIVNPGVIIHIHDIFTPNEYPDAWLNRHLLWNEQYLLEAFLCLNDHFKVLGGLNYLFHYHKEKLFEKCPVLAKETAWEPASFWMARK